MDNYPSMKLNAIAIALGFYDGFHFSKVFKAKTGICPNEYKKNIDQSLDIEPIPSMQSPKKAPRSFLGD